MWESLCFNNWFQEYNTELCGMISFPNGGKSEQDLTDLLVPAQKYWSTAEGVP